MFSYFSSLSACVPQVFGRDTQRLIITRFGGQAAAAFARAPSVVVCNEVEAAGGNAGSKESGG